MKKDDSIYLRHIINAFMKIEDYKDGVIRQLEVMGEAARNLSEDLRNVYPQIPWRRMVGLRNRMIHAYFRAKINFTAMMRSAGPLQVRVSVYGTPR